MPIEAFDRMFPAIAKAEAMMVVVPEESDVPPGNYWLRECYCTAAPCDCRRVILHIIPLTIPPPTVVATVSFGWEEPEYYKDLYTYETAPFMAGVNLPHSVAQGPLASSFLIIFKQIIPDQKLVAAFKRHYRLVKEKVKARSFPIRN